MSLRWKRFRYRLEWFALVLATKLIPLLSRKACFRLANFLGSLLPIFDRCGREVAMSNLEVAFGERFSVPERRRIVRESCQSFTRTMLDLLWTPRLTPENFLHYIELENLERFKRDIGERQSCIFACLHYGNFEWLSAATGFAGFPSYILTQQFKNRMLDSVFDRLRAYAGHWTVHREDGVLRLYKALRRNGRVAILIDLTLPPSMPAVVIDCFGLKTSLPFAHAWLHERTNSPIIPLHSEPLPNGRWRVILHEKLDVRAGMTHQQIAQACWNRFETVIAKNPAPWLWTYKHWRYLPKEANRPYPFYARSSPKFNALVNKTMSSEIQPV